MKRGCCCTVFIATEISRDAAGSWGGNETQRGAIQFLENEPARETLDAYSRALATELGRDPNVHCCIVPAGLLIVPHVEACEKTIGRGRRACQAAKKVHLVPLEPALIRAADAVIFIFVRHFSL